MVEYIRNCSKGVGEVVVMEIAQVGVRTRDMAAEEVRKEKRIKVDGNGVLRLPSSTLVQTTTEKEDPSDPCAAAASLSSGGVPPSCCSSNGSREILKFTEFEGESVEIGTVARCNLDEEASKSRNESMAESGELDTFTAKPSLIINSRRTVPEEKMPPAGELEEFFAAAEKDLRKRFRDKYNYDIVNDTPLQGRFEWVQLKP